jgi:hypothetical protein
MTPLISQLYGEAVSLEANALAESTAKKYASYEVYWVRFLLACGLMAFVVAPSEVVVLLYVAFLARSQQYGSVKNCLKGLQRFLQAKGWSSHLSQMWRVQQALVGLRRLQKGVSRKLPITPFVLLRVLAVLDVSQDLQVMIFASMLIAFAAFLRKANVCAASSSVTHVQRAILRRDVQVDLQQYCLIITLRFMKNAQFKEAVHTVVVAGQRGHPLDPVYWWSEYTSRVPAPSTAAAFGFMSAGVYAPLTHSVFVAWVKRLISAAGFDSSGFSGHSFRRGAASFSFLCGLPDALIKELGAWRSQVYQVYLDLPFSQKLSVHRRWFSHMAQGQLGAELVPPPVA